MKNPFSTGVGSAQFSRPVWDVIGDHVWPTVLLLGDGHDPVHGDRHLPSASGVGWKRGGSFDRSSTGVTLTLYAMPEFWLGMMLLIASRPASGRSRASSRAADHHSAASTRQTLAGIVDTPGTWSCRARR